MSLPSTRDFVTRLATSQQWNCVHEVRMDSRGGRPTPGLLFFSWQKQRQGRAKIVYITGGAFCDSRSLPCRQTFPPFFAPLLGAIRVAFFRQRL
jgi:hypothetical protein